MKRLVPLFISCVVALTICSAVDAQPRVVPTGASKQKKARKKRAKQKRELPAFGIHFGNDFTNDQLLIGGQVWVPMGRRVKLAPSFDYYFVEDTSRMQFNGDIILRGRRRSPVALGGGLAFVRTQPKDSVAALDVGGNLIIGLELGRKMSMVKPFLQCRWTFLDETFFVMMGGINIAIR